MKEKNRTVRLIELNQLRDEYIQRLQHAKKIQTEQKTRLEYSLCLPQTDSVKADIRSYRMSLQKTAEAIGINRTAIKSIGELVIMHLTHNFPKLPPKKSSNAYPVPDPEPAAKTVKKQKKCRACVVS